jgi:selenocysteine-specific elongation factor
MLETRRMAAGETQMIQLRPVEPLALAPGDRFVLRANISADGQSGLTTIGGGRILGTSNVRLRRQKPWTLASLAARRDALDDPARWAEILLREHADVMPAAELQRRCLMRAEEWAALLGDLLAAGRVRQTPDGALVHTASVEALAAKMFEAVQAFLTAHPQSAGIGRDALLAAVGGSAEMFKLAADSLLQARRLEFNGTVFAPPGWSARISDPDQQLSERIAAAFQSAGWTTPAVEELAVTLRVPPDRLIKLTRLLVERGVLVRLDERVLMHRDAVEAGKKVALDLFRRAPAFTTMQFRDALGVSRKFAVPLLDHLDRLRFTVRSGNNRTPGVEGKKLMFERPPGEVTGPTTEASSVRSL